MGDHILLVTDGESDQGEDPVAAAGRIRSLGITVSAVGIRGEAGMALRELRAIARAGGGFWDLAEGRRLGRCLQRTLDKAASGRRAVRLAVVLDRSVSMQRRLDPAAVGIGEFVPTLLEQRPGSRVALVAFPAAEGPAELLSYFTTSAARVTAALEAIRAQGATPTGPALGLAAALFGAG